MSAAATRTGKIARLPKAVRDRLNQQVQDGVPGKDLVRWLNTLEEVREVLLRHFTPVRSRSRTSPNGSGEATRTG